MNSLLDKLMRGSDEDAVRACFARLPVLETERLLLRRARLQDAADIFAFSSDPEVARHVLWQAQTSVGEARHYIRTLQRQYREGAPSSYVMVLKASGHVIGTIGFERYVPETALAEVGYSLARPLWNQGLATEALHALLGLCFDRLHLHRVEAMCDTENPASARVMEKCGMQREGVLRGRENNKGQFVDVVMYGMLVSDWNARPAAAPGRRAAEPSGAAAPSAGPQSSQRSQAAPPSADTARG